MSASGRRILAGLFWLLASLGILLSTVVVWAHQSLLTTSGWTQLVGDVFDDPAVVEGTADAIVERVSVAIDLPGIVAQVLPGESELVAGLVTTRVEDFLAGRLADRARPRGRAARPSRTSTPRRTRRRCRTIRGGGEVVSTEQGTITLNVFPLVEAVLVALQDAGIIDATRQIPDLSEYRPAEENVARLESAARPAAARRHRDDRARRLRAARDRAAGGPDVRPPHDRRCSLSPRRSSCSPSGCRADASGWSCGWPSARSRPSPWAGASPGSSSKASAARSPRAAEASRSGRRSRPRSTRSCGSRSSSSPSPSSSLGWRCGSIGGDGPAGGGAPGAPARPSGEWVRDHHREMALAGLAVIAFFVLWRIGGPDIALLAAAATGIWLIARERDHRSRRPDRPCDRTARRPLDALSADPCAGG